MWYAWDKTSGWQDMTRPPAVCSELIVFRGRCLSWRWPPRLFRPPTWYCLSSDMAARPWECARRRLMFPGTTAFGACNQRPYGGGRFWIRDCDGECCLLQRACWMKIRLSINNRLIHIRLSNMEKFESSILSLYINYRIWSMTKHISGLTGLTSADEGDR